MFFSRQGGGRINGGLSSLALRLAGLLSTFALGVVLARSLGPAEYGVYGLVVTISAIAMTIGLVGTQQLAVRELSVRSSVGDWPGVRFLIRQFGLVTFAVLFLLGIVAVATAFALAPAGDPAPQLTALGALLALATAFTALTAAELRGLGAMIQGQAMDLAVRPAAAFLLILLVVLAGRPLNASGALAIQVLVAAIAVGISLSWVRKAIPMQSRTGEPVRIAWLGTAIPLLLVELLRQLDGAYGMILVAWFATAEELGIFRVALSCAVVVGLPVSIFHIIQAPAVSKHYKFGETAQLQEILSITSAWVVALVAPITLAAWLIGRPAIVVVFGESYADAWLPLFILCLAQLAYGYFGMGPVMVAMCEGERQLIKIYLVSVGLGLAAALPLVRAFGASGAAAATIVSIGLIGFLSWRYGRSRLGVDCTFWPLLRRPIATQ